MTELLGFNRRLKIWVITIFVFCIGLLVSLYIWRGYKDNATYIEQQSYELQAQALQKIFSKKLI